MNSRFVKLAAVILSAAPLLLSSGCSGATTAPPPSAAVDTFAPAPANEVQKAKIAVFTYHPADTYKAVAKQINDTLAAAGQAVEFDVQYLKYVQGNDTEFVDKVKADLAAGSATADAYPFNFLESSILFDAGLTMDLTELVPQNAPVYFSKYKDLFSDRLIGIPTGIYSDPLWFKLALMPRQDFTPGLASVNTVEGLFGFIDETIVKPKKPYTVLAYENDLTLQWALEKGYYTLSMFGVDGYLFCGVNDSGFTPVPIESIPGFADFITRMKQYRQNGSIKYQFDPMDGKECVAFTYDLGSYYVTSPYASVPFAKGEFSAHLFTPDMPAYFYDPVYVNELVVPAVCPKERAAEVIRFIEWMYAGQENYDAVIYGMKGADFNDAGGRYVPLVGGKPLQGEGFQQLDGLFFAWPGTQYLYNFDYFRLPSSAPANVEALVVDGLKQNNRFALGAYIKTDRKQLDKIMKIGDEMKAICKQRDDIINALIQGDPAAFSKESIAKDLGSLGAMKNKQLCGQYAAIIKGLVDGSAR